MTCLGLEFSRSIVVLLDMFVELFMFHCVWYGNKQESFVFVRDDRLYLKRGLGLSSEI